MDYSGQYWSLTESLISTGPKNVAVFGLQIVPGHKIILSVTLSADGAYLLYKRYGLWAGWQNDMGTMSDNGHDATLY